MKPDSKNQSWVIICKELSITVEGQFPLENGLDMGEIGGSFADITSVNMAHPITHWLHGNQESITFEARLFSQHKDHDISGKFQSLQTLCRRDSTIYRQPVCLFKYGKDISMNCFVNMSNTRIAALGRDGSLRDVTFTLTLRKYVASLQQPTDPDKPESTSRIRLVKTGDTYESIAADEYGNAIYGEVLRRFHRYHPDLVEGDEVHVVPLNYVLKRRKVTPQSHPLASNDEALARQSEVFLARSDSMRVIG